MLMIPRRRYVAVAAVVAAAAATAMAAVSVSMHPGERAPAHSLLDATAAVLAVAMVVAATVATTRGPRGAVLSPQGTRCGWNHPSPTKSSMRTA